MTHPFLYDAEAHILTNSDGQNQDSNLSETTGSTASDGDAVSSSKLGNGERSRVAWAREIVINGQGLLYSSRPEPARDGETAADAKATQSRPVTFEASEKQLRFRS